MQSAIAIKTKVGVYQKRMKSGPVRSQESKEDSRIFQSLIGASGMVSQGAFLLAPVANASKN